MMTYQTRLSAKGQLVIPKDVRERLGWDKGMKLEVIEQGGDIVLRPEGVQKTGTTARDALREIQSFYRYDGPPVSLSDMDEAAGAAVEAEWRRRDADPR